MQDQVNTLLQEQKASYKCLDKNNYDRDACQQYFDAYKDCKNKMVSGKPLALNLEGVVDRSSRAKRVEINGQIVKC